MKSKLLTISLLFTIFFTIQSRADEGMWIPMLIEKYNIKLMQEKGFKLQAEDIYSVNQACMKDAIVLFGGGCTGEVISPDGLLITNHHCGYGQILRHSTLEHDYLTNGFWAMSREEELPNPGLTVTFLKSMSDVTELVLKGITSDMDAVEREKIIDSNISEIIKNATYGTDYSSVIRPFFMGNQYFLFVNETFLDVRLVGAPPSSIGKFGGETDNWVWPRHTGDFSLFRIYANKENKPADYSMANVPYKPVYHFPISLKGVNEGDFTMVFGYPGSTSEYVTSYHIDMVKNYLNPKMIDIRTKKIEIMESAINSDPLIRIQYSAKKAGLANSWKRWIGESQGLENMKTIDKKREFENNLTIWINEDKDRINKYGNILEKYKELYTGYKEYYVVNSYTNEIFFNSGIEAISLAKRIESLSELISTDGDKNRIQAMKINLIVLGKSFFNNYNIDLDKRLFVALMTMYGQNLEIQWQVPEYLNIKKACKGNFSDKVDKFYDHSVFTDEARFTDFILHVEKSDLPKLNKDIFYLLAIKVNDFLKFKVYPELNRINEQIQNLNMDYMTAQMEYDKDRIFYADANSSLRIAYGNVKGYYLKDGVYFSHYTTLKGIIEKDNPDIYDYNVPEILRNLYKTRDFGRYTHNGEVPVCFIADNHTTGGNSGSPVINADGHLIGVNFDRAWEGVASDLAYNPGQSRNISLDIRYALFLIDKFAGAGYLLDEMTIIE